MKKRSGVDKVCQSCGNSFYVPQYRAETARFCSKECQNHNQYKKFNIQCLHCDKIFTVSESRKDSSKFCSKECNIAYVEQNKLSESEKRERQKNYRDSNSSRKVRSIAFSNKRCECEICGYNKYDFCVEVHHIDENPDNNNTSNLKVLCVECHRCFHMGLIDLEGNALKEHSPKFK